MPKYDGSGPRGQGPMTGRGMGRCGQSRKMGQRHKMGHGQGSRMRLGKGQRANFMEQSFELDKEGLLNQKEQLLLQLEAVNLKLESL